MRRIGSGTARRSCETSACSWSQGAGSPEGTHLGQTGGARGRKRHGHAKVVRQAVRDVRRNGFVRSDNRRMRGAGFGGDCHVRCCGSRGCDAPWRLDGPRDRTRVTAAESDCLDSDVFGVARQRSEILEIAREHASPGFGNRNYDSVDGRTALRSVAHPGGATCGRLGQLNHDVAGLQQPVGVRIRRCTTGNRFDHDKRRDDGRPEPFTAKHGDRRRVLSIASSEPCHSTTVENEHRSAGSL